MSEIIDVLNKRTTPDLPAHFKATQTISEWLDSKMIKAAMIPENRLNHDQYEKQKAIVEARDYLETLVKQMMEIEYGR